MEQIKEIVSYFGELNLLITIVPSLMINVIIDMTKQILTFKTVHGAKITLNGLLSFLGLIFGFLYYNILDIEPIIAVMHSFIISILSYVFYKIRIYDLLKDMLLLIVKKLGGRNNE